LMNVWRARPPPRMSCQTVAFDIAPVDRLVVSCRINVAPPLAARRSPLAARPHRIASHRIASHNNNNNKQQTFHPRLAASSSTARPHRVTSWTRKAILSWILFTTVSVTQSRVTEYTSKSEDFCVRNEIISPCWTEAKPSHLISSYLISSHLIKGQTWRHRENRGGNRRFGEESCFENNIT
jgi:hypothetical protein